MIVISIVIVLIYTIWLYIRGFVYLSLITFLLFCLLCLYKERKRYNKKHAKIKISETDLIISYLEKLPVDKKIIREDNDILIIIPSGIYYLKVLNYTGIISGNIEDEILIQKDATGKKYVKNEINNIEKLKYKLDIPINKILVRRNDCHLKIKHNYNIVPSRNIYYYLLSFENQKNSKKINVEQIYNKINKM